MKRHSPHTLGSLIELLDGLGECSVEDLINDHSYRGYYDQLAFEVTSHSWTSASKLAQWLRTLVGKTYKGWKGGDYTMSENTPVWVATQGTTSGSGRIIGLDDDEWIIADDSNHWL